MESHRRRSLSDDVFSFNNPPIHQDDQNSDFEFGSVIPDSSSSDTSPADYLFLDGRLLPHVFPLPQPTVFTLDNCPQASQAKGVSRNGSLSSSRSSSCSSRMTNSSSRYELKMTNRRKASQKGGASAFVYGSSRRWQFMVTVAVPSARRESPRRRKVKVAEKEESRRKGKEAKTKKKKKKKKKMRRKRKLCLGWRLFRWLIFFCKQCHAIETSTKLQLYEKNNE